MSCFEIGQSPKEVEPNGRTESCDAARKANGSDGGSRADAKDPPQCEGMIAVMKGLDFPGASVSNDHLFRTQNADHEAVLDANKCFKKSNKTQKQKLAVEIKVSTEGAAHTGGNSVEEQSPTVGHFSKKHLAPGNAAAGINKKLTRKLSRKLTGRMTKRQRQELMLEGEFDEFDIGLSEAEESNETDDIISPPHSDDEDSASDDTDQEFETEIVTQLNMQRITVKEQFNSGKTNMCYC